MYDRGSCRGCGGNLTAVSSCIICREYVSWNCDKCDSMDYVIHSRIYCSSNYVWFRRISFNNRSRSIT